MPVYKCIACSYTFTDNFKPIKCPECGRETLVTAYLLNPPRISEAVKTGIEGDTGDGNTNSADTHTNSSVGMPLDSILYHRKRIYRDQRWLFNRTVKVERVMLDDQGISEPEFIFRKDDGSPLVYRWEDYGPTLKVLYSFETDDPRKRPTLWDVNRINLEKIAMEPSEGYREFLREWADLYVDERHPLDGVLPGVKPVREVMDWEREGDGDEPLPF